MEELQNKILKISLRLEDKPLTRNEWWYEREQKMKELGNKYEKNELFAAMFNKSMDSFNIDDKIVMIYDIDRFDFDAFEKRPRKAGVVENEKEKVEDFKSKIFDSIKKLLTTALETVKELVMSKMDDFVAAASGALAKFLKEQGTKLLETIIDKIRGGQKCEDIEIKVEGQKMALCSVLNEKECDKLTKLAEDINDIYNQTYYDLDERVNKIKNGEEVDLEYKPKKEKKKSLLCCF